MKLYVYFSLLRLLASFAIKYSRRSFRWKVENNKEKRTKYVEQKVKIWEKVIKDKKVAYLKWIQNIDSKERHENTN